MKIKKAIYGIAVAIGIIVLGSFMAVRYLGSGQELPDSRSILPEININEPGTASIPELMEALNIYHVEEPWEAPDFELDSLSGRKGRLSHYRGKHVVLTFWTTW